MDGYEHNDYICGYDVIDACYAYTEYGVKCWAVITMDHWASGARSVGMRPIKYGCVLPPDDHPAWEHINIPVPF